MLKKIYKVLAILLIGFAGGVLAPWFLGWFGAVSVKLTGDAISIANTYIVFTTIIFVGVTVVLAVAGYVFTQQFSASKQSQETHLLDELKEKVKCDEGVGIALANAILENSDVKRHLQSTLRLKVDELLQARLADSKAAANQAEKEAATISDLASKLNGTGDKP